jgi:hypothetical protein
VGDFADLSAQIENDIERYERLWTQVRQTEKLPVPTGYERPETAAIIERVIDELKRLRRVGGDK